MILVVSRCSAYGVSKLPKWKNILIKHLSKKLAQNSRLKDDKGALISPF